jgi:hypothetical protein
VAALVTTVARPDHHAAHVEQEHDVEGRTVRLVVHAGHLHPSVPERSEPSVIMQPERYLSLYRRRTDRVKRRPPMRWMGKCERRGPMNQLRLDPLVGPLGGREPGTLRAALLLRHPHTVGGGGFDVPAPSAPATRRPRRRPWRPTDRPGTGWCGWSPTCTRPSRATSPSSWPTGARVHPGHAPAGSTRSSSSPPSTTPPGAC